MLYLVLAFPKHTKSHFFQLYQKYQFLRPEILSGYIWVWYGTIQYKKLEFFFSVTVKDTGLPDSQKEII